MSDTTFLKRFPKDKQAQVMQLVSWAEMLGLTGRDLVAIGGKVDRDIKARERDANREICKTFDCLNVGADKGEYRLNRRFKLVVDGQSYRFEHDGYSYVNVYNNKTKQKRNFQLDEYELGRQDWGYSSKYWRQKVLLNIYFGKIKLDF